MTGAIVQSAAAGPCTIAVLDPVTRATYLLTLQCANFVPDAAFNLLAVQRLLDQGVNTVFDVRHQSFNGALFDATTGTILCRFQRVGASLLITCPAAPLPDLFDDSTALAHLATSNTFRLRPPPPDVSPPQLRLKMCLCYCIIVIYMPHGQFGGP